MLAVPPTTESSAVASDGEADHVRAPRADGGRSQPNRTEQTLFGIGRIRLRG